MDGTYKAGPDCIRGSKREVKRRDSVFSPYSVVGSKFLAVSRVDDLLDGHEIPSAIQENVAEMLLEVLGRPCMSSDRRGTGFRAILWLCGLRELFILPKVVGSEGKVSLPSCPKASGMLPNGFVSLEFSMFGRELGGRTFAGRMQTSVQLKEEDSNNATGKKRNDMSIKGFDLRH